MEMHLDNLTISLVVEDAAAEILRVAGGDANHVLEGLARSRLVARRGADRSCSWHLPQLAVVLIEMLVDLLFYFAADVRRQRSLARCSCWC